MTTPPRSRLVPEPRASASGLPDFGWKLLKFAIAVWLCALAAFGQPDRRGAQPIQRAAPPNENPPVWMNVEGPGTPIDFFAYDGLLSAPASSPCLPYPYICEIRASKADSGDGRAYRIRPPMTFSMPISALSAPETAIYGCNPPGYVPPSTVFTVSGPFSGAMGLATRGTARGSAVGSPSDSYAVVGAYVASNRCSNSDQEYGFFQNLTNPGVWDFYYSQFTNTVNQITAQTLVTNISGQAGEDSYFTMYILPDSQAGYDFRIQIRAKDSSLRTCSVNGSAVMPCTADIPIDQSFWPVAAMLSGPSYVIEYAQASTFSSPTYQEPGSWTVTGVWLGFSK